MSDIILMQFNVLFQVSYFSNDFTLSNCLSLILTILHVSIYFLVFVSVIHILYEYLMGIR